MPSSIYRQSVVMEMAMREVGVPRILFAAIVGGLTRSFGRSGDFYRLAGRRVAAIDGPNRYTIKPFGYYVVLAPAEPDVVAKEPAGCSASASRWWTATTSDPKSWVRATEWTGSSCARRFGATPWARDTSGLRWA